MECIISFSIGGARLSLLPFVVSSPIALVCWPYLCIVGLCLLCIPAAAVSFAVALGSDWFTFSVPAPSLLPVFGTDTVQTLVFAQSVCCC